MDEIRIGVRVQDVEIYQRSDLKLCADWFLVQPIQDVALVTTGGTPLSVVEFSLQ